MADIDKLIGFMAIMQVPFMKDPDALMYIEEVKAALKTLKEQEPRLLTIEELTGDGECWFEHKNGACGYADCYMCTGAQAVEVNRIMHKPEYLTWNSFMKTWRCWNVKPTDDEKKAVKWDE